MKKALMLIRLTNYMNLDNHLSFPTLDTENQLGSIELLGKQARHAWEIGAQISIPADYNTSTSIVFAGMGGTSLGAYVTRYAYSLKMPVPFDIINDYHLPRYVGPSTLVIIQSYSGETEESLSCFDEAVKAGAHICTISSGGTLEKRAQEQGNPHFHITPTFNPCNQPRMAIGYSIVGLLSFLHHTGFITIHDEELNNIERVVEENNALYGQSVPTAQNPAKQLATQLFDHFPIYIGAEFLQGAIHAMRNQLHENAKSFAVEHPVPEMNHHLLEALRFPTSTHDADVYIFLNSSLYSERIKERMRYSAQIVNEAGHTVVEHTVTGAHPISHVFSAIHFGAYVGLYLALKEDIDPSPIPHVENLKKKLAK